METKKSKKIIVHRCIARAVHLHNQNIPDFENMTYDEFMHVPKIDFPIKNYVTKDELKRLYAKNHEDYINYCNELDREKENK